ncbi:MAG: cellulose synthase/poly-beta-1,6-N-acetylglucosamine synthase-like glycosyltransferase [Pirellulaceae bacterium]
MEILWITIAAFNLVVVVLVGGLWLRGDRQLKRVLDVEPKLNQWPRVSIVVAARNEERNIETGIRSLLQLDYPDYELLVVNDRSTDSTAEILNRLSAEFPTLAVVQVDHLPDGWLGKNHALHSAAQNVESPYVLFSDADVVMDPSLLRRAMTWVVDHHIDHLAITPEARMPSVILKCFVATFTMFFMVLIRPWAIRNPNSNAHIGIGAFNLLRMEAFRDIGGFEPIRMRPDDDLKLGKLIKLNRYSQDCLVGAGMMYVPWYESIWEMARGLEKNTFAIVEYSISMVVCSTLFLFVIGVGPYIIPIWTTGLAQYLSIATAILWIALTANSARHSLLPFWIAFGFPFAVILSIFIQWRAMILAISRGGIQWRDTVYSLKELKANRI